MTKDDMEREVGRTVREYSDNEKAIACLERRLLRFANALKQFIEEVKTEDFDDIGDLLDVISEASDPREDFQELQRRYSKRGDFREFFNRHGLSLGGVD